MATLESKARSLAARFDGAGAEAVLKAALVDGVVGRTAVVTSFGAEAAPLLHLVSRIAPNAPVLFVDTGRHFGETKRYGRELAAQLGLTGVRFVGPARDEVAASDPDGLLFASQPDRCCAIRKVAPLKTAILEFDAWVTGRKRYQATTRSDLAVVDSDATHIKFNPLADWSREEVQRYFEVHGLPRHPLEADGFLSIGCMPCTDRVRPGEDLRAGRWRGAAKTECGIHHITRPQGREEKERTMPIFRNGREIRDEWTVVGDDEDLPVGAPAIVTLARWVRERDILAGRNASVGVMLEAGDSADSIADDLDHVALVQVTFPSFADGRAYSTARLLRERFGFAGEIRAAGDVLFDQIPLMERCGVDSFAIGSEATLRQLRRGHSARVELAYQPTGDGRPTVRHLRDTAHEGRRRLAS